MGNQAQNSCSEFTCKANETLTCSYLWSDDEF